MQSKDMLTVELAFDDQDPGHKYVIRLKIGMDFMPSIQSDSLKDTIDHYALRVMINDILAKKPKLIETLAGNISDKVMENFSKVDTLKVVVTKLKEGSKNIPSAKVTRKRFAQERNLLDFDLEKALYGLDNFGGVSIPILTENFRQRLSREAESYEFKEQKGYKGKANVHEHFLSFTDVPYDSLMLTLKEEFETMINRKLGDRQIFSTPLRLNEPTFQTYKVGHGIEPHLDNVHWVNLICVFMLKGSARFGIVQDRSKNNPYILETTPGNVILMRAPGYRGGGKDIRPFHFIDNVTEERIVGSWRQNMYLKK